MIQETKKNSPTMQVVKEFMAGVAAGVAMVVVGQPFDLVKIRLVNSPHLYNGVKDCFMQILKKEGPYAFYYGSVPPLIGAGVFTSIQFGTYEYCKRLFKSFNPNQELPLYLNMLSGALSGITCATVLTPTDSIRIKLQLKDTPYKNSLDCIKQIYQKFGFKGIMHGFTSTCSREFYGFAIYFGIYGEIMKFFIPKNKTIKDAAWYAPCIGGAITGFIYWMAIYPIDVVKTMIQGDDLANPKYKGMIDGFKQTFQKEGVIGLYKGVQPCAMRAMPVNCAIFFTYEKTLQFLQADSH